jgi:hypothetical protein
MDPRQSTLAALGRAMETIAELEARLAALKAQASAPGLKLDLGCGTNKQPRAHRGRLPPVPRR